MTSALIVLDVDADDETAPVFEFGLREAMCRCCPDIPYAYVQRVYQDGQSLGDQLRIIVGRARQELERTDKQHCLYVLPCELTLPNGKPTDESRALIVTVTDRNKCLEAAILTFTLDQLPDTLSASIEQTVSAVRKEMVPVGLPKNEAILATRLIDTTLYGYAVALQSLQIGGKKPEMHS